MDVIIKAEKNMKYYLLSAFMVFFSFNNFVAAQDTDSNIMFNSETTPLTIDLDANEEEEEEPKKKKRKKNVFYGIKTKKGFVKTGFGNDVVIETFHYLKEYEDPDPYVRDIYWFDLKKGVLKKSSNVDKSTAAILHGPYKRMRGNQIIEEGIFFKGTKHGRWMTYNKNDYLMNKQKYYKGWPKESMVSYYDKERTKLKEVIPVEFGVLEGNYFYFHDNGELAVKGEFHRGNKVGIWSEYYKFRKKRKKEIQYTDPKNPYDKKFIPYIVKEWDEKGDPIYDKESEDKRLSSK